MVFEDFKIIELSIQSHRLFCQVCGASTARSKSIELRFSKDDNFPTPYIVIILIFTESHVTSS